MMLFYRTRGPGSLQQIQLHYLAVCRQVHSCSYLLFIFSKLLANVPVVLLLHSKAKVLFSPLTWLVVSNHDGCRPRKVGSGTMVCMMVEVPLQLERSPRTNNQRRQWFLCRKIRSTIGSGMGRRSQLYLFPLAYQWTRCSVAVVSCEELREGGIPVKIPWFWRSMMDCGNNGGRLPRSDITKV
jgi:hypothetical protein